MPEVIILLTALAVLTYDFVKIIPGRRVLFFFSLAGLALAGAAAFSLLGLREIGSASFFSKFYIVDPFGLFFKALFIFVGVMVLLVNYDFFSAQVKRNEGEFYFLFLSSLLGLAITVSSPNLLLIYLGMELVSFASYLLVGWQKTVKRSNEAALKYFLFGAVASAVFLYGVSLFYGMTGTLDLTSAANLDPALPLTFLSLLFVILGFGFKIAMVPMQFWCPDVYEGAPTPITAYLSVGPKAMGLAVLLRFLAFLRLDLALFFAVFSALTMTWGNLVALRQKNIKRLLAYSSIAQAGYIMVGLVSFKLGFPAVIFYLVVYTLANLGAFSIVIYLSGLLDSEEIENYSGLARRSPLMALAFSLFFLSLIGIPPLAGFIGKFLVFRAAVGTGYLWLAALAVLNSVVSVYYYLNVVRVMYFQPGEETPVKIPAFISLVLWFCLLGTLLLGIFPNLIY
ncbi:NADH-quinone oxidoreductase subunit N [Candidatus Saganbacteria bacterium]|uniref:NADH-quinone oxidoreductase subunit N n=1 Tax=Candidatus Saganbacteria bacterium TaxID=2575572 RepID=A0A9D6UM31_UNCSA|nr:NADH-quinone oxidoreductase subunit N [Candidatus Saganbacteria bacterium]